MTRIETLINHYRNQIESSVCSYSGKPWRLEQILDRSDLASHPSAVLSDGALSVFVKVYQGSRAGDQLRTEKISLETLRQMANVRTPQIIDIIDQSVEKQRALFLLEAFNPFEKTDDFWFKAGKRLADIHQIKAEQFGFDNHNYFGPLYQDNRWTSRLDHFYIERRIRPWMRLAKQRGHMSDYLESQLLRFISGLPDKLCNALNETPALLHGDAQQNNIITDGVEPVFLDPAVYYGHPEIDLAHVDFFQPVSEVFYRGYQSVREIDSVFWDKRKNIWRVGAWTAMLAVDPDAGDSLKEVLRKI